jgi:hypothetical protein
MIGASWLVLVVKYLHLLLTESAVQGIDIAIALFFAEMIATVVERSGGVSSLSVKDRDFPRQKIICKMNSLSRS